MSPAFKGILFVLPIGLIGIALQRADRMRAEHDQSKSQRSACLNNLRQINTCVQLYLIENSTTSIPATTAISSKFEGGIFPTCPAGGTYALPATEADLPTCTLGHSKGHRLSP